MPSSRGLLDLPVELLLSILECAETESLYQLALLSRQLNSLALRIYFLRHNVDPDSHFVECTLGSRDVLSALQISLLIQSLEHIHCSIPRYFFEPSITPFLRHVKRLETFISRLTFVRRATLDLASDGGNLNWAMTLKSVDELWAWSSHVGDLLNCIVQCGCQWLTITDGSVFQPYGPGLINRIRHLSTIRFQRVPVMPRFPAGQSHISALAITSGTFLLSPGIDWILAALEQVTSLCLGMERGSEDTWSEVLPRMAAAAPHLRLLFLVNVRDSLQIPVLSALDQFPHLTGLHIHSYSRQIPGSTPHNPPHLPSPSLRCIESLSATSELVEHLLSPTNALPQLRSLRLEWRVHTALRLTALLVFLAEVTAKLNDVHRAQKPDLALDIDLWAWSNDVGLYLPPEFIMNEDITAGCARVARLILYLSVEKSGSFTHAESVARLVASFPEVVDLSLHTNGLAPSEAAVTRFVEAVKQTKVTEIKLNGTTVQTLDDERRRELLRKSGHIV